MTDQDQLTARAEAQRIAHALTLQAANMMRAPHERVTFSEIMAATSGPAEILFQDVPELEPRKFGALDQS